MNIAFGAATAGAAINSIFDIVNTANYLNNPNPNTYANPFQGSRAHVKYGSDLRHSGIMLF